MCWRNLNSICTFSRKKTNRFFITYKNTLFHQSFETCVILTETGSNVWNPKLDESLVWWADVVKRAVSGLRIMGGKVWANHRRSNYQLINVNTVVILDQGVGAVYNFFCQMLFAQRHKVAKSYNGASHCRYHQTNTSDLIICTKYFIFYHYKKARCVRIFLKLIFHSSIKFHTVPFRTDKCSRNRIFLQDETFFFCHLGVSRFGTLFDLIKYASIYIQIL